LINNLNAVDSNLRHFCIYQFETHQTIGAISKKQSV